MNLQWFSVQVISGVLLVVLSNVYCDGSIENNRIGIYSRKSPVYLIKSPLHRMYLEWLAENLGNREKMNSGEEQIFNGLMEKRDKFSNCKFFSIEVVKCASDIRLCCKPCFP